MKGFGRFAFDREKHVSAEEMPADAAHMLYLSFDFNRNPICCSVIQYIDAEIRVIETIKLAHSDIHALCKHILVRYPGYVYMVTGDASGSHSSALVQDNLNYYTVIKKQLRLPIRGSYKCLPQILTCPTIRYSSIPFSRNMMYRINALKAQALIYDLRNVRMNAEGSIIKANRTDPTQQADALDTFRYYCNVFHGAALGR